MVEVEVELRQRNQMTLPERIARTMGVRQGSRLLITYDDQTGEARIRPLLETYAGVLRGVYGQTPDEVAAYLEEERRGWRDS